jgi:DNA-binding FadR family transcriptional regulator
MSPLQSLSSRGTAVDEVLDWLIEHVRENGLTVGGALPSEGEISKQTGISRNSVREATSYLRALGIVESRPRAGMKLVRDPALIGFQWLLNCKRVPEALFRDVSAFRDAMELGVVEDVCSNVAEEEIAIMYTLFDEIETNPDNLILQFDRDREFHVCFLHAAHNAIVSSIAQILEPLFHTKEERYVQSIPTPLERIEVHREIVQALRERNPDALERAVRHHIRVASWPHYRTG